MEMVDHLDEEIYKGWNIIRIQDEECKWTTWMEATTMSLAAARTWSQPSCQAARSPESPESSESPESPEPNLCWMWAALAGVNARGAKDTFILLKKGRCQD